jgi:hypothetical protein
VLEVSIRQKAEAAGGHGMSRPAPEAALDYSNRDPARPALNAPAAVLGGLGLAGVILAFVATWSPVIKIQVLAITPWTATGYERHSVALILLGVFGAVMMFGSLRAARPAMLALAAAGLVVLLISVVDDLPKLNDTGVWPQASSYEDAQAKAGAGYYLETLSGVLMLVSGVGFLVLEPSRRQPTR